jgi:hypothetical protein
MPATVKRQTPPKKTGKVLAMPAIVKKSPVESHFAATWLAAGKPAGMAASVKNPLEMQAEMEAALLPVGERLSSLTPGGRALMIGKALMINKTDIEGFTADVLDMARRRAQGTALEREGGLSPACARLLGRSLDTAFQSVYEEIKKLHKQGSVDEKRAWLSETERLPPGGKLLERTASLFEAAVGRITTAQNSADSSQADVLPGDEEGPR